MSSRPDVTAMLSSELERQVLSKFRLWGSEVKLHEGDRFGAPQGGRVDYMEQAKKEYIRWCEDD